MITSVSEGKPESGVQELQELQNGQRDIATASFAIRGSSEITAFLRGVAADSRLHSATPELLQLLNS
jgi:hypothetical protein